MPRILRSILLYVVLLASGASALSACVVYPYEGGGDHYHRFHGGHHDHDDRGEHDYRR